MTVDRSLAMLAWLAAAVAAGGCGAHSATSTQPGAVPVPTPADLIVLLPDEASGTTGRAVVATARGTIDLDAPGAFTRVSVGHAPAPPQTMSEMDVRSTFGELLASLPPPASTYTLYFHFDSEALTPESRAQLPEILRATRQRSAAEVVIIGHTDRSGSSEANVLLGLKRAEAVREVLIDTRIAAQAIRVTSHGEAEPVVATADNVFEPRNRRVDVTVR